MAGEVAHSSPGGLGGRRRRGGLSGLCWCHDQSRLTETFKPQLTSEVTSMKNQGLDSDARRPRISPLANAYSWTTRRNEPTSQVEIGARRWLAPPHGTFPVAVAARAAAPRTEGEVSRPLSALLAGLGVRCVERPGRQRAESRRHPAAQRRAQ